MNWLLIVLAISMPAAPIKPEYCDSVAKIQLVIESQPCDYAGWTGPDNRIHICATPGLNPAWIASHELTHILAGHNLSRNTDWDRFAAKALSALRQQPHYRSEYLEAKYMAGYGGQELHAELPWIVRGRIPKALWPWYPWFERGVKEKGDEETVAEVHDMVVLQEEEEAHLAECARGDVGIWIQPSVRALRKEPTQAAMACELPLLADSVSGKERG